MSAEDEVLETALAWVDAGRPVALATVVATWGSSPRPRGSQLAVRDDGLFVGSVSGGCVEGKVVEAAQAILQGGAPRVLEFGVSNEDAWEVGLACGGKVRIYVDRVRREEERTGLRRSVLEDICRARADHRPLVVLTPLDGGAVSAWSPGSPPLAPALHEASLAVLASDDAASVDTPSGAVFVQPRNPPLRLVLVGAVHIAEPLASVARLLGYAVTILDPREAFARAERWPGVMVKVGWPDEILADMAVDARTAIVALTHDPKIDDPALEAALRSPAFYVGALGSRKTHAARLQRLRDRGFDADALGRIHGPVGLDIRARSPGEIAVSILAQVTETLRRAPPATKP